MIIDPFTVHAIDHLSPSSCNLYIASPASWVMKYLLKMKDKVGTAAYRGSAVEAGVAFGLVPVAEGANDLYPLHMCQAHALAEFDKLAALSGDTRRDKEREGIPAMVEQALDELRPYGRPSSMQGKVEMDVPGLAVPLTGYYDFYWEGAGVLTDLKTLWAMPSSIRTSHARQAAFYAATISDNIDARVTYVTGKKRATYQVENARAHVEALHKVAHTIGRFLSLSDDPKVLAGLVVPDVDSFYFSDPVARQNVFETWGM